MFLGSTSIGRIILDSIVGDNLVEKTASISFNGASQISEGLNKVASLPYNEMSHESVREMMKTAANYIDSMLGSLKSYEKRASDMEKVAEVRCVIDDMLRLGMIGSHDVHEKVAELAQKSPRDIEVIKEAMKLAQSTKASNIFFENDNEKTASSEKRGMFDEVIDA